MHRANHEEQMEGPIEANRNAAAFRRHFVLDLTIEESALNTGNQDMKTAPFNVVISAKQPDTDGNLIIGTFSSKLLSSKPSPTLEDLINGRIGVLEGNLITQLENLNKKLAENNDEMNKKLAENNAEMNNRLNQVNDRIAGLEQRLEENSNHLNQRIDLLEGRMTGLEGRMTGLEDRMTRLEQKVDNRMDEMKNSFKKAMDDQMVCIKAMNDQLVCMQGESFFIRHVQAVFT